MINLKTRIKNPVFWLGLAGTIASPILAYNGAVAADITTWGGLGDIIVSTLKNPYLLGSVVFAVLGFLGVVADPNTKGLSDSERALGYEEPAPNVKEVEKETPEE